MDRFVVMVDAGYLLHQSLELVSRRGSTRRAELDITDPSGLINLLVEESKAALGVSGDLLRVYWYDGVMPSGLTPQQRSIVELPDVNFRSGTVNSRGQQKGVDSLIVTDLIELAANHAICDAALVTGDGDLAIGIDLAQKKGVRIAVLGVEDLSIGVSHSQSFEITSRADRVARIGHAKISAVMRHRLPSAPPPAKPGSDETAVPAPAMTAAPATHEPQRTMNDAMRERIRASVAAFVACQSSLGGAVDPETKRIDATVDRALIHHVFTELATGKLTNDEKICARERLRAELGL